MSPGGRELLSEFERLSQCRAPGGAGPWGCLWERFSPGLHPDFLSSVGGARVCACVCVSRGAGAGRRLEGRWCHFINSGAKVLRSSSRSPFLSFAGDLRRNPASEPLQRSFTSRIPAFLVPSLSIWSPFIFPYLFFGISFFSFLFSSLRYHSKDFFF